MTTIILIILIAVITGMLIGLLYNYSMYLSCGAEWSYLPVYNHIGVLLLGANIAVLFYDMRNACIIALAFFIVRLLCYLHTRNQE